LQSNRDKAPDRKHGFKRVDALWPIAHVTGLVALVLGTTSEVFSISQLCAYVYYGPAAYLAFEYPLGLGRHVGQRHLG
jgi:hypothetical protein